jgi:hypothetical protein
MSLLASIAMAVLSITYMGIQWPVSGSSSAVERQLPKLDVAGSIPVSRSIISAVYG